jgi:hypothetical protein
MAAGSLLGSRISLISNKDIRYEGVLFAINQEESSVTLQNGACVLGVCMRVCAYKRAPVLMGREARRRGGLTPTCLYLSITNRPDDDSLTPPSPPAPQSVDLVITPSLPPPRTYHDTQCGALARRAARAPGRSGSPTTGCTST